jgi:hypothetical protein
LLQIKVAVPSSDQSASDIETGDTAMVTWASLYGDPYGSLTAFMGKMTGRVIDLGSSDDIVIGTGRHDLIRAGAGADRGSSGSGNDWFDLGPGNDRVRAGDGHDFVYGNDGNDTIVGDAGNDILDGGPGKDRIFGISGNDIISGGDGDDLLDGGEGRDVVSGDAGNDTVRGFAGNDTLKGNAGNDSLWGGWNADHLEGGEGNDRLEGQDGDDALIGGTGNDRMDGGSSNDALEAGPGDDVLIGNTGADRLDGGPGADLHRGGDGNDVLAEEGVGSNRVFGDAGDDRIEYRSEVLNADLQGDLFAGAFHGGGGRDSLAITNDAFYLEWEGLEQFPYQARTEIHWTGTDFAAHFAGEMSDDFPGRRAFTFVGIEQVELKNDIAIDYYGSGLFYGWEYDRPLPPAPDITIVGSDASQETFDAGWGGETFITAGGRDFIDLRGPKDGNYDPITEGTRGSSIVVRGSDTGEDYVRGFGISPGDRINFQGVNAADLDVTRSGDDTVFSWGAGRMTIEDYAAQAGADYFFV